MYIKPQKIGKNILKPNLSYKEKSMFTETNMKEIGKIAGQFATAFKSLKKFCDTYTVPESCSLPEIAPKKPEPFVDCTDSETEEADLESFAEIFMKSKGKHCSTCLKKQLLEQFNQNRFIMDRMRNCWELKNGKYKKSPLKKIKGFHAGLNTILEDVKSLIHSDVSLLEEHKNPVFVTKGAVHRGNHTKIVELDSYCLFKVDCKHQVDKNDLSIHHYLEALHAEFSAFR